MQSQKSGVDIGVWGPAAWNFMYAVAFAYPDFVTENDQQGAIAFFRSLIIVLPCIDCRRHMAEFMEEYPIEQNVASRELLCSWVNMFHNSVNARTGKPATSIEQQWDRLVETPDMTRHMGRKVYSAVVIILFILFAYAIWKYIKG